MNHTYAGERSSLLILLKKPFYPSTQPEGWTPNAQNLEETGLQPSRQDVRRAGTEVKPVDALKLLALIYF